MRREPFHHQVSIAGQVKDAIAGKGISGATVKIIDAPDRFINFVIFQAQLWGLPSSLIYGRSLENLNLPDQLQNFQEKFQDPHLKNADKLKIFQTLLSDSNFSDRQKFQAFQEITDYSPTHPQVGKSQLGRTQTSADGWFHFDDLPDGLYDLEAFLPNAKMRYTPGHCQIKIGKKNSQNILDNDRNVDIFDILRVELELQPTTLLGKVTNVENTELISMARVEIQGSGDYTLSLAEIIKQQQGEWNYRLVGLEARNTPITVIVSVKGYPTKQEEINLQPGEVKSLDFQLVSY